MATASARSRSGARLRGIRPCCGWW